MTADARARLRETCIATGCDNPAIGGPADRGSSRYCRQCITRATKEPDPDFYPSGGIAIPEDLRRP